MKNTESTPARIAPSIRAESTARPNSIGTSATTGRTSNVVVESNPTAVSPVVARVALNPARTSMLIWRAAPVATPPGRARLSAFPASCEHATSNHSSALSATRVSSQMLTKARTWSTATAMNQAGNTSRSRGNDPKAAKSPGATRYSEIPKSATMTIRPTMRRRDGIAGFVSAPSVIGSVKHSGDAASKGASGRTDEPGVTHAPTNRTRRADAGNVGVRDGQLLWSMLWFFMFFVMIWLLIMVFTDIFRSQDLSGWAKAAWIVFVFVLTPIGILVYLIVRGHKMGEHAIQAAKAQDEVAREYIRQASGTASSPAQELTHLAELKDKGVIDDAEFQRMKTRSRRFRPGRRRRSPTRVSPGDRASTRSSSTPPRHSRRGATRRAASTAARSWSTSATPRSRTTSHAWPRPAAKTSSWWVAAPCSTTPASKTVCVVCFPTSRASS